MKSCFGFTILTALLTLLLVYLYPQVSTYEGVLLRISVCLTAGGIIGGVMFGCLGNAPIIFLAINVAIFFLLYFLVIPKELIPAAKEAITLSFFAGFSLVITLRLWWNEICKPTNKPLTKPTHS